MVLSIVVEFEIIEQASKAANCTVACFPMAAISVNQQFAAGLFQPRVPITIFFDSFQFTLGLVRFELAFWLFNIRSEPNEKKMIVIL